MMALRGWKMCAHAVTAGILLGTAGRFTTITTNIVTTTSSWTPRVPKTPCLLAQSHHLAGHSGLDLAARTRTTAVVLAESSLGAAVRAVGFGLGRDGLQGLCPPMINRSSVRFFFAFLVLEFPRVLCKLHSLLVMNQYFPFSLISSLYSSYAVPSVHSIISLLYRLPSMQIYLYPTEFHISIDTTKGNF